MPISNRCHTAGIMKVISRQRLSGEALVDPAGPVVQGLEQSLCNGLLSYCQLEAVEVWVSYLLLDNI